MEIKLARDVKSNKKGFYSYKNRQSNVKENIGLLLNGAWNLTSKKRLRYSGPPLSQPFPALPHRQCRQLTDGITRPLFHQKVVGLKGHLQCLEKANNMLMFKGVMKAW